MKSDLSSKNLSSYKRPMRQKWYYLQTTKLMIIVLFLHLSWVLRKQSLQKWSYWATIVLTMKTRDRTNVCFLLNK